MEKFLKEYNINIPSDYLMLIIVSLIFLYILMIFIMNNYHKLAYGKYSLLAFIPVVNIYVLGKLLIHKVFGFILLFLTILSVIIGKNFEIYFSIFTAFLYVVLFIKYFYDMNTNYRINRNLEVHKIVKPTKKTPPKPKEIKPVVKKAPYNLPAKELQPTGLVLNPKLINETNENQYINNNNNDNVHINDKKTDDNNENIKNDNVPVDNNSNNDFIVSNNMIVETDKDAKKKKLKKNKKVEVKSVNLNVTSSNENEKDSYEDYYDIYK